MAGQKTEKSKNIPSSGIYFHLAIFTMILLN